MEALRIELEQEAQAFHLRLLAPDWLIRYIDAKELDLKDEHDQVKKAVHFLIIGVNFETRKEVLCSKTFWGHETLDTWRQVFGELKNHGLTRMLLLVTDDFSGLVDSFWPYTDHPLCPVPLLRHAHRQRVPKDYPLFRDAWREIRPRKRLAPSGWRCWRSCAPTPPPWVAHLQPRTDQDLRFINYPGVLRLNVRSTNLPEGSTILTRMFKQRFEAEPHPITS